MPLHLPHLEFEQTPGAVQGSSTAITQYIYNVSSCSSGNWTRDNQEVYFVRDELVSYLGSYPKMNSQANNLGFQKLQFRVPKDGAPGWFVQPSANIFKEIRPDASFSFGKADTTQKIDFQQGSFPGMSDYIDWSSKTALDFPQSPVVSSNVCGWFRSIAGKCEHMTACFGADLLFKCMCH